MLEASNHVKSSSPLFKKDMFNRPGDLYKQTATPLHGAPPSGSGRIVAKDTVDQPLLDRSLNVTDAIAIDTASNEVLAAKIMRGAWPRNSRSKITFDDSLKQFCLFAALLSRHQSLCFLLGGGACVQDKQRYQKGGNYLWCSGVQYSVGSHFLRTWNVQ